MQVSAHGRQTVLDRGVVKSCDPLQIFGAPIISPERLNLKSSNFVHAGYIKSSNRVIYHEHKRRGYGHVTVLNFCRLS